MRVVCAFAMSDEFSPPPLTPDQLAYRNVSNARQRLFQLREQRIKVIDEAVEKETDQEFFQLLEKRLAMAISSAETTERAMGARVRYQVISERRKRILRSSGFSVEPFASTLTEGFVVTIDPKFIAE